MKYSNLLLKAIVLATFSLTSFFCSHYTFGKLTQSNNEKHISKNTADKHSIKNASIAAKNSDVTQSEERTFAMIKPDAVIAHNTGDIIKLIELNGFTIIRMKKIKLTKQQAQHFYAVHKEKPFYADLVQYITSGPVVLLALEKDNAIKDWRTLMGVTNPKEANTGTLRKMFGTSKSYNAVHGSDASETAKQELSFFFPELD